MKRKKFGVCFVDPLNLHKITAIRLNIKHKQPQRWDQVLKYGGSGDKEIIMAGLGYGKMATNFQIKRNYCIIWQNGNTVNIKCNFICQPNWLSLGKLNLIWQHGHPINIKFNIIWQPNRQAICKYTLIGNMATNQQFL